MTQTQPLTGRKVLMIVTAGFAVIVGANLTLAYHALKTFPGLEVRNSYVASQSFERDRAAQLALNWDVSAEVAEGALRLSFLHEGSPVEPELTSATLGRATRVSDDFDPAFVFDGRVFTAPVDLAPGYWNLRITARAADGTAFRQRLQLWVTP